MKKEKKIKFDYDPKDLESYRSLPAVEKLRYLEEVNAFLSKAMSPRSKRIWEELKNRGF